VRKPGKNKTATTEQKAAYLQAKKAHNLSRSFVEMVCELRQDFDSQCFEDKTFIAVGDGSFCNKASFRQPLVAPSSSSELAKTCDSVGYRFMVHTVAA
jgi:hypothetical protein